MLTDKVREELLAALGRYDRSAVQQILLPVANHVQGESRTIALGQLIFNMDDKIRELKLDVMNLEDSLEEAIQGG
jgi:hypothetical protein